jgi:putative ABC transport system permease protein
MNFTTLQLAVRNLLLHKLRSLLTMLGTILGVGSVISMLAIGEGSMQEAVEQIRQLGANNVIVRSVKPEEDEVEGDTSSGSSQQTSRVLEYGLLYKDFDRLTATLPTVKTAVPIALVRRNAQHSRFRIANARILGTTPEYLAVKNLTVRRGRFLSDVDLRATANVAVLGAGAAKRLFSYQDPIEKPLLLGEGAYRVVGVLDTQGSGSATPGAIGHQDFNNDIYIPLTAAQRRFGELQMIVRAGSRDYERTQLSEITLEVWDENEVSQTAAMARAILKKSHARQEDFEIQVPLELLKRAEQEKRIWNIVLGSIAGISLLVGGIGIMNIMLATVTERTREIGIRRALGAKRWDITVQFLFETVVLSATGGLLGIIVGLGIPIMVTLTSGIRTALSLWPVLLAFGISVSIGIVFGMYPARRAALLDPIEALRYQ